jgi:hypothetical protein
VQEYGIVVLGCGMVAGYAAKQLVENGIKPGELGGGRNASRDIRFTDPSDPD